MLNRLRPILFVFACGLTMAVGTSALPASDDAAFHAAVHDIVTRWETIKFSVGPGEAQTEQMTALSQDAAATSAQYPGRIEAMIWSGIIAGEVASMTKGMEALRHAREARAILEKAHEHDPGALEAGGTTALGVLYYRVPGWPIGFGDAGKARELLEQATQLAPNNLDAWYFYGDFLYREGRFPEATTALEHALKVPLHPDRHLWDRNRRQMAQDLLASIQQKS